MWPRFRSKLRYWFRGERIDRDLAEELDFHRDMLTEDQERLGHSHADAVLNARRRMGNTTLMMEHARDAWCISWLDTLLRDVRYSLRTFARHPAFTVVAVLTLALGIGANTAMFRLMDIVMLRSLPVRSPEELVTIRQTFSYEGYKELRDRNEVFSGTIGVRVMTAATLSADGQPLGETSTALVTGNYFGVLGVIPVLGRPIEPADDVTAGSGPVAVISHGLWRRAFGGSPSVLGRTIRVSDGVIGGGTSGFEPDVPKLPPHVEPVLTVIGVAPPEFFGDTVGTIVDMWVPITMQPVLTPGRAWLTRRSAFWVNVMGRRRPGVSEDQVRAHLPPLWRQIRRDQIGPSISERQERSIANARFEIVSGQQGFAELQREFSRPVQVLMAVVTLVLLIACLNVANLLLARATARSPEISMRLSLGASRGRVIRQLLTETILLAGTGGALGLLLATVGAQVLGKMVAADIQQHIAVPLAPDWRVLSFTIGLSLLSGAVFGVLPALRATRLQHELKMLSRGTRGTRSQWAKALVAAQIAVSLVLLVGCGLFLRTLFNLKQESLGYEPRNLVLAQMDPVSAGYRGEAISRAAVELSHRLSAIPGVRSVTFSENGLFSGIESATSIDVDGFQASADDDRTVRLDQVGPGYFTGVGIPLVVGRDFSERDTRAAPPVGIVNETLARFYFPGHSPVGRHLRVGTAPSDVLEIIGVAQDARNQDLREEPVRRLYVSYLQPLHGITTLNFELRAASDPSALFGPIREETRRFDPKLLVLRINTAQALIDDSIANERVMAKLSTMFGALAAVLAAIGLYGVMSYTVTRRTGEIGVRIALGASRAAVASMILRDVIVLVGLGSVVGAAGAIGLAGFVESLVFGLTPHDPLTLIGSAALLVVVGLLAGYLPARRAARIDPIVALRRE